MSFCQNGERKRGSRQKNELIIRIVVWNNYRFVIVEDWKWIGMIPRKNQSFPWAASVRLFPFDIYNKGLLNSIAEWIEDKIWGEISGQNLKDSAVVMSNIQLHTAHLSAKATIGHVNVTKYSIISPKFFTVFKPSNTKHH